MLFRDDTDKNGELTIEEAKLRIVRMNDEKIEKVLNWDVEKFINDNDKDGDRKVIILIIFKLIFFIYN